MHNQEHGGVVLHYGNVGAAQLEEIREWWRNDPNGIVVSPLPSLGTGIALTAWNADLAGAGQEATDQRGILAKCPRFDAGAAAAFVDEYGFRGPERFDRSMLTPGQLSPSRMPGEGLEPSRPESRPILSRVRLTSSATPARPSMVAPRPTGLTTLSA